MAKTVVLAVLDSLRYDFFLQYVRSYQRGALYQLYSNGTRYSAATAPAPWSLPSHASMFTGRYPREHGATRITTRINDSLPLLSEELQTAGFTTGCYTANTFVQPEFGFEGWDAHRLYDLRFPSASIPDPEGHGLRRIDRTVRECLATDRPVRTFANGVSRQFERTPGLLDDRGRRLSRDAATWMQNQDTDCFLFVNFMETHFPHKYLTPVRRRLRNVRNVRRFQQLNGKFNAREYYTEQKEVTEEDRRALADLIASEVAYVERQLGRILDALRETNRLEETLFILCSDHGDALGERDFGGHVVGIGEPIVRVPLVIYGPDARDEVVEDRVSLTQIRDTIAAFADLEYEFDLRKPATCPDRIGAENTDRLLDIVDREAVRHPRYLADRRAVYPREDPGTKWLSVDGTCSTYETTLDSVEEKRVSDGGSQEVDQFFAGLHDRTSQTSDIQGETERQLRDLGYL